MVVRKHYRCCDLSCSPSTNSRSPVTAATAAGGVRAERLQLGGKVGGPETGHAHDRPPQATGE